MNSHEIRKGFLEFFAGHGHPVVKSSPLIPEGDPTLLFTSAGMVQFKPYYLGLKTDMKRAASCQKSFRTTDIDNVGRTIRHLTFFEMLGNFSFGDYFKAESIKWGWDFLTREMGLPAERFYPSIYRGGVAPRDEEARGIWESVLPANLRSHIVELGDSDNFWAMGDTGPSGPCSEIYWDRGEKYAHPGCAGAGCSCDRYIEVWNHVFTQFDKRPGGVYAPLPKKNIDTGMGLERLAFIVEGKESPFDTTLFRPIITAASGLLKAKYDASGDKAANFRIISDHLRASVFLISEGIIPSNEGRGYVLRRLIRRAERFGRMLGAGEPFLYRLVPSALEIFRDVYPGIVTAERHIVEALKFEEEGFLETLETGERFLADILDKHPKEIPGDVAFRLYETYGFPVELTREIALKKGVTLDEKGFEAARKNAQATAKAGWKDSGEKNSFVFQKAEEKFPATIFRGYESLETESVVLGLINGDGEIIERLPAGESGRVILDITPFYARSGGQIGDVGDLITENGERIEVSGSQKPLDKVYFHDITFTNVPLEAGMRVKARVFSELRYRTACNHTAAHIVNAALRQVFGENTRQAGSDVDAVKFRFDYTVAKTPAAEDIERVENISNTAIAAGHKVFKMERPLADAEKFGAVTLLGEKYRDPARFVLINKGGWNDARERYSLELCGGTHVDELAQLMVIKILKDSAVSRGVRRIEGVAGPAALEYLNNIVAAAERAASRLSAAPGEIDKRVEHLLENERKLRTEVENLKKGRISGSQADKTEVDRQDTFNVVLFNAEDAEPSTLRHMSDQLKPAWANSVIFVHAAKDGKLSFVLTSTADLKNAGFNASGIAKAIAAYVGGNGGGRKDFAQGGGQAPGDPAEFKRRIVEIIRTGRCFLSS